MVRTQRRPDQVTTTDFQSALSEDHHRPVLPADLDLSKHPDPELRLLLATPHTGGISRAKPLGGRMLALASVCTRTLFPLLGMRSRQRFSDSDQRRIFDQRTAEDVVTGSAVKKWVRRVSNPADLQFCSVFVFTFTLSRISVLGQ
jgi:hypothetical protein